IWVIILLLCNLKANTSTRIMFYLLNARVHLATIADFSGIRPISVIGGYFGILLALAAFYNCSAILINKNNSLFNVPVG
ncbi:hypothetical protein AYI68_g8128, partial [Smittium mucronatum]